MACQNALKVCVCSKALGGDMSSEKALRYILAVCIPLLVVIRIGGGVCS